MQQIAWRRGIQMIVSVWSLSLFAGLGNHAWQGISSVLLAADDSAKQAASVEEAIKVLDLRTVSLPGGAVVSGARQVGSVSYETKADPKKAFQVQQQQFVKLGWKELPGSMAEAAYGSGLFQKSGFVVSVTTSDAGQADKPGLSRVFITNFGNVRLDKLPVIKGAKSLFINEATAMYVADAKVADAAGACRKLLLDAGWEPYGTVTNPPDFVTITFKRNAVQLLAAFNVAPAQGGKTSISYSTTLLSADIPAPANAEQLSYVDMQKTLRFDSPDDYDAVAKFYRQTLGKRGWTATTEQLVKTTDQFKRPIATQVFRNSAKDILSLDLQSHDGKTQAKLTHLTADEFAESERKAKEAAQKAIAQKNTPPKTKPMPADDDPDVDALIKQALSDSPAKKGGKVGIPIPEKAKKVDQTSENVLQIKVAAGKGQSAAEFMRDQLADAGWKVDDDAEIDDTSGNVTFKKGPQQLTLTFVDTGLTDVNIMVIGIGTKLEPAKADPNAKAANKKSKSEPDPKSEPKSSKKTAGKKSKPASDDEAVAEPKRKDKPKRGIAKLSKLPNEGTITLDDKPFKLTNIIAYEVISNGQWRTKIVATEKPIKQEPLLAMLKKSGNDNGLELPQPYLRVELDDEDRPASLSLVAGGTPGGATSGKLQGEVLVEDGRARGTVKLKEPGSFFDKVYTAELSFDVAVLTRDATPAKRLTDAPKLDNSGTLTLGGKTYKLPNVVAYEVKASDEKRTALFFSEKPINLDKLKASLKKDGTDDGLFEFQPQIRLQIDKSDAVQQMHLWADNTSINSNANLTGDVVVEDGRARGTAKLAKPGEFFGKEYTFEVTFDVEVLLLPTSNDE